MRKDSTGGGNTITGLVFETRVDLRHVIGQVSGYEMIGDDVFFQGRRVATLYQKRRLYKNLLKPREIDWTKILSKQLLPDETLYNYDKQTLFVIEMKYQQVEGSVDEKLQTCDFKKKQYQKLLAPLKIDVEYVYLLNDWFQHPKYRDTLNYVKEMGCHYFFDVLPFDFLGLPQPEDFSEIDPA